MAKKKVNAPTQPERTRIEPPNLNFEVSSYSSGKGFYLRLNVDGGTWSDTEGDEVSASPLGLAATEKKVRNFRDNMVRKYIRDYQRKQSFLGIANRLSGPVMWAAYVK